MARIFLFLAFLCIMTTSGMAMQSQDETPKSTDDLFTIQLRLENLDIFVSLLGCGVYKMNTYNITDAVNTYVSLCQRYCSFVAQKGRAASCFKEIADFKETPEAQFVRVYRKLKQYILTFSFKQQVTRDKLLQELQSGDSLLR
jgi:hypothetical protein